jgi:hypothetical protein
MKDWELLAQIKHKIGKLENGIIDSRNTEEQPNKSAQIDDLVDLTNYSLFLLDKYIDEQAMDDAMKQ